MSRFGMATCVLLSAFTLTSAQQSTSFQIEQGTFNAGGHPESGSTPTSASFRISLDAVGDAVAARSLAGTGFSLDAGFVTAWTPPSEVTGLRFLDATTLTWNADGSVGDYALYLGTLDRPFDPAYGACTQPPPAILGATASVTGLPSPGDGWFLLVTARNRLGEEGPKGSGRPTPVACP